MEMRMKVFIHSPRITNLVIIWEQEIEIPKKKDDLLSEFALMNILIIVTQVN